MRKKKFAVLILLLLGAAVLFFSGQEEHGDGDYALYFLAEPTVARGGDAVAAEYCDLSLPGDTDKMFEELKRPFDIYHRYGGEFYVVHTFDHMTYPQDDAFEADCRKRSIERLGKFNEICKENGVQMVAENIAFGGDERYLFTQDQFLEIFRQLPDLNCLIDLGHAALAEMDVYEMQKELKGRIKAYHIHDNNGKGDQHQRIYAGIRDWEQFAKGVAEFTPDATGVMEYWGYPDLNTYLEDRATLEALIAKYK